MLSLISYIHQLQTVLILCLDARRVDPIGYYGGCEEITISIEGRPMVNCSEDFINYGGIKLIGENI